MTSFAITIVLWVSSIATLIPAIPSATVPSLAPEDRITASGSVDDAEFIEHDQIVVLTSKNAAGNAGQKRCSLSVWDIQQKKWLMTKPIDTPPPSVICGHLDYSTSSHRLVVSTDHDILVVNTKTLKVEKQISVLPNHLASKLEPGDIFFALSDPGKNPVTFTSYQVPDGTSSETRVVPGLKYSQASPLRIAATSDERVAILQSDAEPLGVPTRNSTLTICTQHGETLCNSVPIPIPVANFELAEGHVLLISADFPDSSSKSRSQCIESLSLSTLLTERDAYCSPGLGVHYSVATLTNDFVVGYSGRGARRGWLDDGMIVTVSSSISVWDAKTGRLVSIAHLPHGKSFTLSSSVIRPDNFRRNRFLFFNPAEGGEILLYDLACLR